jgi:hypothetical protein
MAVSMALIRTIFAVLAIRNVACNEVSITFEAGPAGLTINEETGNVIDLSDGGQAERMFPEKGIDVPAMVRTINGDEFSFEGFDLAQKSTEPYTIVFEPILYPDEMLDSNALLHGDDPTPNVRREDCKEWEDGNCETCFTWTEWITRKAKCLTCPDGWAVIDGPPVANKSFTSPDGEKFKWVGHCAEIDPDTEKRVIAIRHGLSTWNEKMEATMKAAGLFGLFIYKDAPLAASGLRQVQRLAHIIHKSNVAVYGDEDPAEEVKNTEDYRLLKGARVELEKVSLENAINIKEHGQLVVDDLMVKNLTSDRNRLELDILVGRKCNETAFVASPLVRAIDTLLIGTMERNQRCTSPWEMSSNLQELEHNLDCEPKTQIGEKPIMASEQLAEYQKMNMGQTADMVSKMYKVANPERHTIIRGALQRTRLNDHTEEMIDELETTMSSPQKYRVWGGHSIWFRHFFRHFADQSNTECRRMGKMKMANTAMISFRLRRLKSTASPRKFVVDDCKFIHLHSDKIFKMKPGKNEL